MERLLNIIDWNTIVGNFNTIQTFINGATSAINNLLSRMTTVESSVSSVSSLLTRMSSAETSITNLTSRVGSMETWRANKHIASANISTSFSLPTFLITLGLASPTKAGIEAALSGLASEINGIKQILRDREILAT